MNYFTCFTDILGDGFMGVLGIKWLSVDVIEAIRNTDLMGLGCLLVLAGFSVISWAVIIYKFLHIRQATMQTDEFIDGCMSTASTLEEAYNHTQDYPDSPLSQILRESYLELQIEDWYQEGYGKDIGVKVEAGKIGIERVLERTISSEIRHMDNYLMFVATTANVCPFIGLFGTVWGILGAFQSIAHEGTAALSSLAPGVTTALTTTVAGLLAAIPAAVCYNYLTSKIQILVSRMDSFALELANIIHKEILKRG